MKDFRELADEWKKDPAFCAEYEALRVSYPVNLETAEDGRVVVSFPDLPGCRTDGADVAEALAEAADALDEWLFGRAADEIPPPSPANGRPMVSPAPLDPT